MRDPFDNVCACEHETENYVCLCTRRKLDDRTGPCANCMGEEHRMVKRDETLTPARVLKLVRPQ